MHKSFCYLPFYIYVWVCLCVGGYIWWYNSWIMRIPTHPPMHTNTHTHTHTQVSFEEVHLHSVIIPTHYNAGFCRGHCNNPIPPGRAVFHSRLMSMSDSAPNPCCVPVAYQSVLTVQYDASSKIFTLLVLWNMSASQCGCRWCQHTVAFPLLHKNRHTCVYVYVCMYLSTLLCTYICV